MRERLGRSIFKICIMSIRKSGFQSICVTLIVLEMVISLGRASWKDEEGGCVWGVFSEY